MLLQAGNDVVDVVDGEHDATDAQRETIRDLQRFTTLELGTENAELKGG